MYSEIKLDNVTTTALELANRAYSHTVITINTITDAFSINTDLFTYNIILCYTFTKFIGIMIDTRALKYFTVRYSQFFAL